MSLPFLVHPALDLPCPSCPLTFLACPALVLIVLARNFWLGILGILTWTSLGGVDPPTKFGLGLFPLANLPSSLPAFPQVEAET